MRRPPLPRQKLPKRKRPMTVCIAAICRNPSPFVVAASDAMLTAGDIEYEPLQPKVYRFTGTIAALISGDIAQQVRICNETFAVISKSPEAYTSVQEIAQEYSVQLQKHVKTNAETRVLSPFGLTMDEFLSRQREFSDDFVQQITGSVSQEKADCSTIMIGCDHGGPHIYLIDDIGLLYCQDGVGFAAIGAGDRHASSEFMFAHFNTGWTFANTLLLTYSAKRRAEVAPGVGKHTFVSISTPEDFYNFPETSPIVIAIDKMYSGFRKKVETIQSKLYKDAETQIDELLRGSPEQKSEGLDKPATPE